MPSVWKMKSPENVQTIEHALANGLEQSVMLSRIDEFKG